jgi:hypothetical protein
MVSHKGALYDDDSRNRGDKSFSDKSQGSKTTNASSLATAVSNSDNGEGIDLVAGLCHARTQARNYNDHWVICMGPVHASVQGIRAREREESHGETRLICCGVQQGWGKHKLGVMEDTLMSEKEARERAGCLR